MIKADIKVELFNQYLEVFTQLSNNTQLKGAKSFLRVTKKSMLRDYKKGLRQIDKKVKVFIELGKFKKVCDGMVEEVFPKSKQAKENKVIEVHGVEVKKLSPPKKPKN